MFDRLLSLLVAVILSLLVWLYSRSREQEVLDSVALPVQVVLDAHQADHYQLELTGPTQVTASFTGPPHRIRELQGMLRRREVPVVLTVTASEERLRDGRYTDTVVVGPTNIQAPVGVTAHVPEGANRVSYTIHRREQEVLEGVLLPVQVVLSPHQAEHYQLELTGPTQVPVSFTGLPHRIKELQGMLRRREVPVTITVTALEERLRNGRYTDAVVVGPTHIQAPAGITAHVPEGPNRLPYTIHRLVERELRVRFEPGANAPAGAVVIHPATVLVRGPQEVLDRAKEIATQPSDLPARTPGGPATPVARVPVLAEVDGRPVRVTPPQVTVRVLAPSRKVYELSEVPVHFLCPPNFYLRPKFIDERTGKVSLKVTGPIQDEPPRVYAFIDLTKGRFVSGLNHEPLQLQLPKDFQAHDPPRVLAFELLAGDLMPSGLGGLPPGPGGVADPPAPPEIGPALPPAPGQMPPAR
jgi:hypothetical protein